MTFKPKQSQTDPGQLNTTQTKQCQAKLTRQPQLNQSQYQKKPNQTTRSNPREQTIKSLVKPNRPQELPNQTNSIPTQQIPNQQTSYAEALRPKWNQHNSTPPKTDHEQRGYWQSCWPKHQCGANTYDHMMIELVWTLIEKLKSIPSCAKPSIYASRCDPRSTESDPVYVGLCHAWPNPTQPIPTNPTQRKTTQPKPSHTTYNIYSSWLGCFRLVTTELDRSWVGLFPYSWVRFVWVCLICQGWMGLGSD